MRDNVNKRNKLIIKNEFLVSDYININNKIDNINRKFYIIIELKLNKMINLKDIIKYNKLKYI